MPYASLDEAFLSYDEMVGQNGGGGFDLDTSNPDLINPGYMEEFTPALNNNKVSMYGNNPIVQPFTSNSVVNRGPRLSSEPQPSLQQSIMAEMNGVRVPTNQMAVNTPDNGYSMLKTPGSHEPPAVISPSSLESKHKHHEYEHGDCSDGTCLRLIDHILSCPGCAKKLKQLMRLTESTPFGIDFSNWNVSKVIFWLIVAIIVIAVYEMLNNIFNRLRGI